MNLSNDYVHHQSKCIHEHDEHEHDKPVCKAGIAYQAISAIPELRPCTRKNWNPENRPGEAPLEPCPCHRWPTPQESKEHEKQELAKTPVIDRRTRKHRHLRSHNLKTH